MKISHDASPRQSFRRGTMDDRRDDFVLREDAFQSGGR